MRTIVTKLSIKYEAERIPLNVKLHLKGNISVGNFSIRNMMSFNC